MSHESAFQTHGAHCHDNHQGPQSHHTSSSMYMYNNVSDHHCTPHNPLAGHHDDRPFIVLAETKPSKGRTRGQDYTATSPLTKLPLPTYWLHAQRTVTDR